MMVFRENRQPNRKYICLKDLSVWLGCKMCLAGISRPQSPNRVRLCLFRLGSSSTSRLYYSARESLLRAPFDLAQLPVWGNISWGLGTRQRSWVQGVSYREAETALRDAELVLVRLACESGNRTGKARTRVRDLQFEAE
jgi:hypothetical protein